MSRNATLDSDLAPVEDKVNRERLVNLVEMAFWHNDAGNVKSAILACEAALAINPVSSTAHSLLGSLYEKQGDYDRAITHIEQVVALNPESTADVTKLEQLRSGMRIQAVNPPSGYRWVPPALAGVFVSKGRTRTVEASSEDKKIGGFPLVPALCSIGGVVVVLAVGAALIHSQPAVPNTREAAVPVVDNQSGGRGAPAYSQPYMSPPPPSFTPAPISIGPPAPIDFSKTPDVFQPKEAPLPRRAAMRLSNVPPAPSILAHRTSARAATLPPLQVVPMSPSSGGLAPASVSLDNIPTHQVMVSQLPGSTAQGSQPGQSSSAAPSPTDGSTPVISVTVHDAAPPASPSSGSDSTGLSRPDNDAPAATSSHSSSVDRASSWQQTALSEQLGGNMHAATAAYEQAIKAYKAQISSGRDVDAAQRGLRACQTGLELCQQAAQ